MKLGGTADINQFGHHEPPAARASRARPATVARGGGGVLHQNRTGLRVRGLPREVVHRRPRLRLRNRRGLLSEPLRVPVHVHRGRTRVRSPQVSPHSPAVHAHQVPGVLSGVRSNGARVCLRGQNVPPAGGVQGERPKTLSPLYKLFIYISFLKRRYTEYLLQQLFFPFCL